MIKEVILFLSNPKHIDNSKEYIYAFIVSVSLTIINITFTILIFLLIQFLRFLNLIENTPPKFRTESLHDFSSEYLIFLFIIDTVFFYPLYEEICFRLNLKLNKLTFVISLSFTFDFIYTIFNQIDVYAFDDVKRVSFFLLVLFIVVFIASQKNVFNNICVIWSKYYIIVFYFYAISFGVIHGFNFTENSFSFGLLLYTTLYVIPHIVNAVFLGYLRLKYGFFWSWFAHAFRNSFAALILITTNT